MAQNDYRIPRENAGGTFDETVIDKEIVLSDEITAIKKLTAAEYAALGTKDSTTMYVIVG